MTPPEPTQMLSPMTRGGVTALAYPVPNCRSHLRCALLIPTGAGAYVTLAAALSVFNVSKHATAITATIAVIINAGTFLCIRLSAACLFLFTFDPPIHSPLLRFFVQFHFLQLSFRSFKSESFKS
jgi:hypothetical protein